MNDLKKRLLVGTVCDILNCTKKKKESHFCLSSVGNIYFCNTKPPRFSWVPPQYIDRVRCSSRLQPGTEFLASYTQAISSETLLKPALNHGEV